MYTKGGLNETRGRQFISYLQIVKKTSENTKVSYKRDLYQMMDFFEQNGIKDISKITVTNINSYVLNMEKEGKAPSTISRSIASMKAFFHYMLQEGKIKKEPTVDLKPPKITKKPPVYYPSKDYCEDSE